MLDITRGGREIQARPGSMLAANYIGHVADGPAWKIERLSP